MVSFGAGSTVMLVTNRMWPQGISVQYGVIAFSFEISRSSLSKLIQIVVYEVLELVNIDQVPKEIKSINFVS